MPEIEAVVDTTVIRRANVALSSGRGKATLLSKRLKLLCRIQENKLIVLISPRLLYEYKQQIKSPMNEFVRAFFELLAAPHGKSVITNWKRPWSGSDRAKAARCRFPNEDKHVLRTAVRGHRTTIYTEEGRMLITNACLYREFKVHVFSPT